jgi:hypothetical protein
LYSHICQVSSLPAIYYVFGHDGSPQGFTSASPSAAPFDSDSSATATPSSDTNAQAISEIAARFKESLQSQKLKRRLKSPLEARFQIFPGPRSFDAIVQFASGFAARERKLVAPAASTPAEPLSSTSTPSQTATELPESPTSSTSSSHLAGTTTDSEPSQEPQASNSLTYVHDEL